MITLREAIDRIKQNVEHMLDESDAEALLRLIQIAETVDNEGGLQERYAAFRVLDSPAHQLNVLEAIPGENRQDVNNMFSYIKLVMETGLSGGKLTTIH